MVIALPQELSDKDNIEIAKSYCSFFTDKGLAVDLNIHKEKENNPHAHI